MLSSVVSERRSGVRTKKWLFPQCVHLTSPPVTAVLVGNTALVTLPQSHISKSSGIGRRGLWWVGGSQQSPHEQRAALPRDPRESSCSSLRQWYERLAAHHPGEHNHRGRHPDLGLPVSKPLETKQWWLITARWDMMMSQQPRIKTVLALDSRWCWHQIITPGVRGQPGLTLRECHPFSCKRLDTWLQLGQNP